jgi:hypothetical protein
MRSSLLPAAGVLAVVLAASVASADESPADNPYKSDAVRAAALFAEGRQLLAAEDYAAACAKLAESQALDPAADTALDLGICYQKASQAAFMAARALAPPPERSALSSPSLAVAPEAEAPKTGHTQRAIGLAIGGVGVAGLVAGVITAVMARSAAQSSYESLVSPCGSGQIPSGSASPCNPSAGLSQFRSAHDLATASSVSFLAGVAAVGAGAIVFFTAPKSKTTVGMGPATEGAGLSVAGRF